MKKRFTEPKVGNIPAPGSLESYPDVHIKPKGVTVRMGEDGHWYILNDDGTLGEEFQW